MKHTVFLVVMATLVMVGCNSPKVQSADTQAVSVLDSLNIIKITKSEYDAVDTSFNQTFCPEKCTEKEIRQIVDVMLDEQDRVWFNDGDLSIEVGHFKPMGMPAVRIVAPIDDLRRFHLGGILFGRPLYADFAYALSPEGYFVGQVQDGNLNVTWNICRIDGYEQRDLPQITFDGPRQADEFRWAQDGWLYIKMDDEYFKLHVDIPMTQNCSMKDIEVSRQEFEDAYMRSGQENMIRGDRQPDAEDTATLRAWAKRDGTSLDPLEEEPGYISFEYTSDCIELAIGDYCCTLLKGDTVAMQTCGMVLSADCPRYFGGVNMDWGEGELQEPAYIYIYQLSSDHQHVVRSYIYQTTPAWEPTQKRCFWGAGRWFYVEGYDRKNNRVVYHKLHL